jgi:hypothetical protein
MPLGCFSCPEKRVWAGLIDVIGRKSAMSNDDRLRETCDGRLTSELSIFASAGFPTLNPSYDEAGIKATETMQGFKKSSNQAVKMPWFKSLSK